MIDDNDGAWFAAKSHGLGAGLPIAWQGWAFVALHICLMIATGLHYHNQFPKGPMLVGAVAVLAIPIYAAKTRGGWKWRWGKD